MCNGERDWLGDLLAYKNENETVLTVCFATLDNVPNGDYWPEYSTEIQGTDSPYR